MNPSSFSGSTAEELVHGHAVRLPGDVPQRLIQSADRGVEHNAATPESVTEHRLPQVLDPRGILTDQMARHFLDGGLDRERRELQRRLAPAVHPFVRLDLDEEPVALHATHHERLDLGDLHVWGLG